MGLHLHKEIVVLLVSPLQTGMSFNCDLQVSILCLQLHLCQCIVAIATDNGLPHYCSYYTENPMVLVKLQLITQNRQLNCPPRLWKHIHSGFMLMYEANYHNGDKIP